MSSVSAAKHVVGETVPLTVECGHTSYGPMRKGWTVDRGAIRIDQFLGKARGFRGRVAVEPFSAGECPEIRVERPVLLIDHKNVLYLLLKQPDHVGMRHAGLRFVGNVVLVHEISLVSAVLREQESGQLQQQQPG